MMIASSDTKEDGHRCPRSIIVGLHSLTTSLALQRSAPANLRNDPEWPGTEVSRETVAQLITAILQDQTGQYVRQSLGVNQPGTHGDKPSFY